VKLPERIGKYQVVAHLGRGGMGNVYKAHDPLLERMVAIKVMTDEAHVDAEARTRFMREARSAARLNHPNIITVYELGEENDRTFIVMELLEGAPLSRVIERVPPVSLREKLAILVQVCDGLAFAHQRGVVHRDVKPANIFVLEHGQVKILDFGIARLAASELTRTGLLMGTPNYMSPEQARGRRTDARSDIFSAGVVCYELLSGRRPFAGGGYVEVLEKLRSEEPAWLGELQPGLPSPVVDAVHRALAKDAGQRYQRIEDFRAVFANALEALDATEGDLREAVGRKLTEVVRLHRVLVATVGAAALGDEKLPVLDQGATGVGLRTLLRELEQQAGRLHEFARHVEQLEPAVGRGIAAAERGAYAEAARELDAVLAEIPQHQRAREYRERVRIEEELERTVRALGVPRPEVRAEPRPLAEPPPVAGPVAVPRGAGTTRSDPPTARRVGWPRAVGTGAVVDETHAGLGRRGHYVLMVVAVLAVAGGGMLLFGPLSPPRASWVGSRGPTVAPPAAPPQATAPSVSPVAPKAPAEPSAPAPPPAPSEPRRAPPAQAGASAPVAEPKPAPPKPAEAKPVAPKPAEPPPAKAPPREAKAPPKPSPTEPKPTTPVPTAEAPPSPKPPQGEARSAARASPRPSATPPLTEDQQKAVEDALTLAQLFQARGDHERARREFQKILDLDPTHAEARQGLALVEQALKGSQ